MWNAVREVMRPASDTMFTGPEAAYDDEKQAWLDELLRLAESN